MVIQSQDVNIMMMLQSSSKIEIERKDSAEISVYHDEKIDGSTLQSQKKVSFCPDVYVIETLHLNNYTKKEKRRSWYLRSQLNRMKKELQSTIQLMMAGGEELDTNDEHFCLRGLENRSGEGAFKRRAIRMGARRLILEKQKELRNLHVVVPVGDSEGTIPSQYMLLSNFCSRRALHMGIKDEMDANNQKPQRTLIEI